MRYLERDGRAEVSLTGAGTTVNTPFTLASVGKSMTAVAVLRLVAQGAVSLDDSIAAFVDTDIQAGFGGLQNITLAHLLTMTSGLPDYLDDAYIVDVTDSPREIQNAKTALSYAYGDDRIFKLGKGFDYANTNYVLLGLALENITGLSYAGVMQREVFDVVGMANAFVFGSQPLPASFPEGHENGDHIRDYYQFDGFGDGGVIATAPDVAKFYRALFIDRSLLPAKQMRAFLNDPVGDGYGMGIDLDNPTYGHPGGDLGFATDVRINVETGDVAIMLSADAAADTAWTYDVLGGD